MTVVFAEQQIGRLQIAAILWSDGDEPRVRHRLRQLLHQTNSKLGAGIRSDADDLRAWDAFPSDVAHFRQALAESRLRDAASLLSAGFAPSRPRAVGRRFEEWAEEFERSLRRTLRTKAAAVWSETTHEGRWEAAQDAAEALYLAEPGDVEAVSKVMEARARLGRIGAAEAAYAAYVETLDGAAPGSELRRQIEAIRALSTSDQRLGPTRPGPFVGRSQALRDGQSALDRVGEGQFAFVLVTGEPGIGKTRLLQELQREALLRDFRCLHASPVELEQRIPLNPLLDALQAIDLRPHLERLGRPWSSVIGSVLPSGSYGEWAEEVPPIQESSLSRRLLDAFTLLLESIARERPTVFFLDDLHWADATTVAVLQFLQRRWASGSFGIVASLSPDGLAGTEPAAMYGLSPAALEVTRISLGELSQDEAVELIQGHAGRRTDVPVERLCDLAGRHPLFLTELTRDYLAGRLRLPDLPVGDTTIPVSLKEILRSRLDSLSDSALRVARLLAVAARPVRLVDLVKLLRFGLDECADSVEELERGRLVEVDRDSVRITHDLFRRALYENTSQARRTVLHRAFAEHLVAEGTEGTGELAIHFGRGGEKRLAAKYGWNAARRAWENGAMAEAAYLFELVADCEEDPDRRADATASLARALYLSRDLRRANPLLELAASRLRERGRTNHARRLEVHRVEGLAGLGSVPPGDLLGRLDVIIEEARAQADWEAVALAQDTALRVRNRQGDVDGILKVFDGIRETADSGSDAAVALCHAALAMQALFGDPEAGLRSARLAVTLAGNGDQHRLTALMRLLVVLQHQGRLFLPEAQEAIEEARSLAERTGDLRARFNLEGNLALALIDAGELDQAETLIRHADCILGSADLDVPRLNHTINHAELALARHDFELAERCYQSAEALVAHNGPAFVHDAVGAGLGICALETGNLSEARRREQDLGQPPRPWFYDPTTILSFRARLMELRGDRPAAIALLVAQAADLEGRLVFAWLKTIALLSRMQMKDAQYDVAAATAHLGAQCASTLRLPRRVEELTGMAERAARLSGQ